MACWFNVNNITTDYTLMSLGDTAADNDQFSLRTRGATAGDPIAAIVRRSTFGIAATSTGYSASVWNHAAAVFTSATSRAAYLNGAGKGTDATNLAPTSIDATGVGFLNVLTAAGYFDGSIAEAAIWDVALTDADVAILATGASPLTVKPGSLVAYWPLIGAYSPEIDLIQGRDLTVTGAAKAAHPRIFNIPGTQRIHDVAAAVAASISGAVATATASALAGVITAQRISSVSGEVATATADSLAGTITASRIVSIAGDIATATASALTDAVKVAMSIAGEVATAIGDALAGVISSIGTKSITGETATAEADAKAGSVVVQVSATGEVATATGDAYEAVVTPVSTTSVTGETSTADATAPAGTVLAGVSITGTIAEAMADAIAGTISTVQTISVSGATATVTAVSELATITASRILSVAGEVATTTADALAGVITAVRAPEKILVYFSKIPPFRYLSNVPSYKNSSLVSQGRFVVSLSMNKVVTEFREFKNKIKMGQN
jgi:hypothetical protein